MKLKPQNKFNIPFLKDKELNLNLLNFTEAHLDNKHLPKYKVTSSCIDKYIHYCALFSELRLSWERCLRFLYWTSILY